MFFTKYPQNRQASADMRRMISNSLAFLLSTRCYAQHSLCYRNFARCSSVTMHSISPRVQVSAPACLTDELCCTCLEQSARSCHFRTFRSSLL